VTYAAVIVLGYLLGSCPWGYWLVRVFRHEDIRKVGSGNIGISNVWRTYGKTLGIPLVFLDFGKGFLAALVGMTYVSTLAGVLAGAAALVGHWRPLFLGFERGGKLIATGGGIFFAIAPLVAATGLALWVTVFFLFGYASAASLCTAAFMPLGCWLWGYDRVTVIFGIVGCAATLRLHAPNLRRLFAGTEHRSGVAIIPRLRLEIHRS
jgi:glycerol-3-phosphate acyltransferase PlsY